MKMDLHREPAGLHEALSPAESAVLHLLHEARFQLRKLTLSDEEARWLLTEHDPDEVRRALERLCEPHSSAAGGLAERVPNSAGLHIYRITPAGRRLAARYYSLPSKSRT